MPETTSVDPNRPFRGCWSMAAGSVSQQRDVDCNAYTPIFTEGCAVGPGVVNTCKNTCFHDV